jgi:hypothetical protein
MLGSRGGMEKEVQLAEVSLTQTARGNTRYVARDTEGAEYSTFRDEIGERARRLEGTRVRVEFHEERRGQYRNVYLDGIEPVEPVEPDAPGGQAGPGAAAAVTDPDEAAWRTAVEAAPWLIGEPGQTVPPEELYDKLKPFEEKVAEDIEQVKRDHE